MPFHQAEEIRYHTFESLQGAGVLHASITRRGGLSPSPWDSLNVGGTVGDDPQRVMENRRRSFKAFGRTLDSLYDVWQVHGTEVVCTDTPRPLDQPHLRADAILTDTPGVTLFMRFADCVPIFLFDQRNRVVGLVHAGWLGTVEKVVSDAVRRMKSRYRTDPADILAGIGPSIGPHHYPVGEEVVERVRAAFGPDAEMLLKRQDGSGGESAVQFDLWSANRLLLQEAGVRNVEISEICTACHLEDWYSHRAEKGRTGRFGALIGL
jgi:hypothetical protein